MDMSRLENPGRLDPARAMAHAAAQLLYRAAVANADPRPGDEHSNLGWSARLMGFETHPLGSGGVVVQLGLDPLSLHLADKSLRLDGVTEVQALDWLDAALAEHGLAPASGVAVTYDLPGDVLAVTTYRDVYGAGGLAAWFDLASRSIDALVATLTDLSPGPVRCWPHHFDIASYVSLEPGDAEEARGIGVGLSPGDGSYDQPYFFVNPWPHLDRDTLPPAIPPGHWHLEGFVGSVATGVEILTLHTIDTGVQAFLNQSFHIGRERLFP
jgi:hypothetical protein